MKPNFALSLSFDGIRLLHRAAGGWHLVGEAAVSDPDLPGALARLLKAGRAVKTRKFRSKLIIPDEQIKYLTIDTPDMDDDARREAALAALDGATPYPVDALAFDISPDGPRTHIAAVARETLREAEAFAVEHRFQPVSFVAAAEGSEFLGEPFFGKTAHAMALLPPGATVVPDGVRVIVVDKPDATENDADAATAVGPEAKPDAPVNAPVIAPKTAAVIASPKAADPVPPPAPQDAAPSRPDQSATPGHVAKSDAKSVSKSVVDPTPEPTLAHVPVPVPKDAKVQDATIAAKAATPTPDIAPEQIAPKPDASKDARASSGHRAPVVQARPSPDLNAKHVVADAPAAPATTGPPKDAESALASKPETPTPDPDVTTPPLLGFATRRRQDPSSTPAPARLGGASRDAPPQRTSPPVTTTTMPPRELPSLSLTTPPKSVADSLRPIPIPVPAPAPASAPVHAPPAQPEGPPIAMPEKPAPSAGGFLSRRKLSGGAQAALKTAKPKNRPKGDVETDRMTVFGARTGDSVGGKPRFLGLILMAILLVFLAGVAAWATVFMEDGLARLFQGRERTLASTLPDDARDTLAQDVGATTDLPPNEEELADGIVVAALNDSLSEDGLSAEDAAVLDALRDPLPDPIAPEDLDAAELEARYAVTGIWPKAPDLQMPADLIDLEDLYVTSIDPVSPALDAVALPTLASLQTDDQLSLVTSPAAAGTNFALGTDGRLIPTVDGALSPDGFTVYLGRPPAVPPATLVRADPQPEVNPNLSALAQVRPQPRPTDLVEQNERATLGGLSRTELAGLRPRLRPQSQQQEAAPAQEAAADVEDVVEAPPSALAAAVSLRPETRPRNFQRIVARATPTAPAPEPAATRTASVAPRATAPSIPSSASVAREATVRNAINLRQVNLIGVYGTPSNRRALVRLGNGRYQKVEVGDRFDGGRVSAIGEGELRYQKGNRNLILKMPQG